jgi:hypothetical protein
LAAAIPASAQQRDPIGQGLAAAMRQAVAQAAAVDAAIEPAPQDKPPADQPADKDKDKDKDKNPLLKFFDGTELSGFVDIYYAYNFNKPDTPCAVVGEVKMFNCLHNFDFAHNSFALNLAELALEKKPTNDARIGYRIDFDYGPAAAWIHGTDPGGTNVFQNIEQAYVSYLAPIATGSLQFDFGEFVTPAGNEVIETKDNWNYTRSLLFALAIPYYHMGVRAAWSPNDKYSVTGFLFNGWNNAVDNNTGKSIGISLTAKPTMAWTLAENYIGGPEQPGSNVGWRNLSDTVVGYTVDKATSVALNYDIGHDAAMDQTWQGIALYLKYQANDWFAVTPRYEWTNDACTPLPGAAPGAPCVAFMTGVDQHVQEFTLTTEFKQKDGLIMRIEYRGDFASTPYFLKSGGATSKSQNELLIGWIYAFSTKMP